MPVGLGTWSGLVFVNPDPAAVPFADWLGDLPAHMGPFDTSRLTEARRLRIPVASNWKLYIENHVDVLHLWYLHDETLGMYDHTGFLHRQVGPHWVSEERLRPGTDRPRGPAPDRTTSPRTSGTCCGRTSSSRTCRRPRPRPSG